MTVNKKGNVLGLVVFLLISLVLLLSLFYSPKLAGFASSGTYVNGAPSFNNSIPLPNITFPEDSTETDAINLNLSFSDPDGDELTFKVFGNSSVVVTINETTKNVTISANSNYNGVEQIYFVADDGNRRNVTSNTIIINTTPVFDMYWGFSGTNFSLLNLSVPISFFAFNTFGIINFTSNVIDFSANATLNQDVNLSKSMNISFNRIEINSSHLPELNQTAYITFLGLTFSNARILRNGVICPTTICTELSESGGTLFANVTGFSIYSTEETPGITGSVVSGGGGGSKGGEKKETLEIDKDELKIRLKHGETIEEFIKLKNNLAKSTTIVLDLSELEEFLVLEDGTSELFSEFVLGAGESKLIPLTFFLSPTLNPNIYFRKIFIKSATEEKSVQFIIEALPKELFFDLTVEIPDRYKEISPGEETLVEVTVFSVGGEKNREVLVDILVQDFSGEVIAVNSRVVFVESSISFTELFLIPEDTPIGKYLIIAKTEINGETIVASTTFFVSMGNIFTIPFLTFSAFILPFLIVLIIVLIIVILLGIRRLQKTKEATKLNEFREIHFIIISARKKLNKDPKRALALYLEAKDKFKSAPLVVKKILYPEAKNLAKKLRRLKLL